MNSGPIVAMVWEGLDAVKTGRGMDPLSTKPLSPQHKQLTSPPPAMLGATNPLASAPGTIRGGTYIWFIQFLAWAVLGSALGSSSPSPRTPQTRKRLLTRGHTDLCLQMGRNVCHGSDSVESANKEIALWFKNEDLVNWESAQKGWVYE